VFAAGADHAGGAYSALTNPLTGLRGFTSKRRGKERGKEGRGRGGEGWRGNASPSQGG